MLSCNLHIFEQNKREHKNLQTGHHVLIAERKVELNRLKCRLLFMDKHFNFSLAIEKKWAGDGTTWGANAISLLNLL